MEVQPNGESLRGVESNDEKKINQKGPAVPSSCISSIMKINGKQPPSAASLNKEKDESRTYNFFSGKIELASFAATETAT
jgi:hypothetical protein